MDWNINIQYCAYLAGINEYLESLRAGCVGSHVDYTTIDTSRPLDAVLSEFFASRASTLGGSSVGARL